MEFDTILILFLLAGALTWWLVLHVSEERQLVKKLVQDEQEKQERLERVRRLRSRL